VERQAGEKVLEEKVMADNDDLIGSIKEFGKLPGKITGVTPLQDAGVWAQGVYNGVKSKLVGKPVQTAPIPGREREEAINKGQAAREEAIRRGQLKEEYDMDSKVGRQR
jgi:hypothetical protein